MFDRLTKDDENKFTFVPCETTDDQVYDPNKTRAKGEIRINGRSLAEKIESMKIEMTLSKEEDAQSNLSLAPSSSSSTTTVKLSSTVISQKARKIFKVNFDHWFCVEYTVIGLTRLPTLFSCFSKIWPSFKMQLTCKFWWS